MAIVSYTIEEIRKMRGRTDWKRLRKMRDEDIDYSDIPALTDEELARFQRVNPVGRPKSAETLQGVYMRLPRDVVKHLRNGGKGWQTRFRENISKAIKKGVL